MDLTTLTSTALIASLSAVPAERRAPIRAEIARRAELGDVPCVYVKRMYRGEYTVFDRRMGRPLGTTKGTGAVGHTIIKPTQYDDFYVVYSSVADAPIRWGTRADLEAAYAYGRPDKFDRADETGTSSLRGWYGWTEQTLIVREGFRPGTFPANAWAAIVPIAQLRQFCESIDEQGYWNPPAGMITWDVVDDDEIAETEARGE